MRDLVLQDLRNSLASSSAVFCCVVYDRYVFYLVPFKVDQPEILALTEMGTNVAFQPVIIIKRDPDPHWKILLRFKRRGQAVEPAPNILSFFVLIQSRQLCANGFQFGGKIFRLGFETLALPFFV
jgi:hypothetical protein